jgi:hypothetical protein
MPCVYPRRSEGTQTHEGYGQILGNGSSVVYITDKESFGTGRKFTMIVLSETV